MKKLKLLKAFIITLLILSVLDMPYDYYTLLRWLIFVASAYFAYESYKNKQVNFIWVFGSIALLFNPILPVYLERITWNIIDIIVALLYVASMFHKYAVSYNDASSTKISTIENAISLFESASDGKDSSEKNTTYRQKINEIKTVQEHQRLEDLCKDEKKRIAAIERAKLYVKIAIFAIACTVVIIVMLNTVILPAVKKYKVANNSVLNTTEIGDIVYFGAWNPDKDESSGKEDISWIVLDRQGSRVLLISEYCLDEQHGYSPYINGVTWTWETCTLRKWLNDSFIDTVFSDKQKTRIAPVTNLNPDNSKYFTEGGNDTTDKVFLLSVEEVNKYFSSDFDRATCRSNDIMKISWWLRSPGDRPSNKATVFTDGSVNSIGNFMIFMRGVRPALWVTLEP